MAISLVQKKNNSSNGGSSLTVTLTSGTTAGNLLVAFLASDNSSSDTFTLPTGWSVAKTEPNAGSGAVIQIAYLANCAGGVTSLTFSRSSSSFAFAALVAEYSGIATTSPLDQTNGATGGPSTSITAGSVTTTQASELLVEFGLLDVAATFSAGTGLTMEDQLQQAGITVGWEDEILSSTGTYSPTITNNSSNTWTGAQATFKGASGGGTVNGSATVLASAATGYGIAAQAGIFDGLSGTAGIIEGFGAQGLLIGHPAASTPGTLTGTAGVVEGFGAHGDVTASSAATASETLQGAGALGTGVAGAASLGASSAATPSDTLTGTAGLGGGVGGVAGVQAAPAATPSLTLTGAGAFLAGLIGAVANLTASGGIGGAIHGAATILAQAAALLGFGAHANVTGAPAASTPATLTGTTGLVEGMGAGSAVAAAPAASTPATARGTAGLAGGLAGTGLASARSAATPSLQLGGAGAFSTGFAAAQALLSAVGTVTGAVVGIWRWAFSSTRAFLAFAFGKPAPTTKMVFAALQPLVLSFSRETPVAQPNTTIQVTMTATDASGNPVSNLASVTCTVTFPDGSTTAYSIGTGISNAGSGKYVLTYTTKGVGENLEDWSGQDGAGNKAEYHNETPVSF